jgi:hypothetical protein
MNGKTKISDDWLALFEENILWFEISVNDFLGVQRSQTVDDSFENYERLVFGEFFAFFGKFIEIASLTELGDDDILLIVLLGF